MPNLLIAFVTGLTTGGLSCLAVQGGLLASSLAGQIEKDFQTPPPQSSRVERGVRKARQETREMQAQKRARLAQPILAFLVTKILAYTLLGFLLGLVGQVFQLSPAARAALQIAIGIFMLGNALRILNVHPIFRYFVIEPPSSLRKWLRRTARQNAAEGESASLVGPAFLGLMTVLIPCGVTQAMMAVALGTGSPAQGAALMFAFTLGTSPVFFAVSYFATQLGARLEKYFMRFVAVVILVLAVVTVDSGLTLAGSPYSLSRMASGLLPAQNAASATQSQAGSGSNGASADAANGNVVTINVVNSGYLPRVAHARAGQPVTLRLLTKNVSSCSRAVVIPGLNIEKVLDATGEATIQVPAQAKGTSIEYSCSMGMYTGTILFDL
jgi:uncharacterized protein